MEDGEMKNYYVIWRADGDDFLITLLTLEEEFYVGLANKQIIEFCWDAEYPDEDNPYVKGGYTPYDIIDVVTGDNIQFVGKL